MFQSVASTLAMMHAEFLGTVPAGVAVFPQWMGVPLSLIFTAGIIFAYRGYGVKGLSILMAYITALIVVQLSMKQVLHSFPYPLFLGFLHFNFTMATVCTFLKVTGESNPEADVQCPKFQKWFLRNVVPTCICQYLAITLNNVSLVYIGAGINAMIGLATPIVTALVAACFGLKIATFAWLGVMLTVGGDALITMDGFSLTLAEGSGIHLFVYGILLSAFAMATRGAKTVLQDKLMNNYGEEDQKKLSPLQSWFMQGPVLIILGMVGTIMKEGLAPWQALPSVFANPVLLLSIMGNIAFAACLNISAVYTIKLLGAPAAQIAGKMNVLVVASLSCALLGETLTLRQGASTLFIIAGAAIFEKAQKRNVKDLTGLIQSFKGEKYDAMTSAK